MSEDLTHFKSLKLLRATGNAIKGALPQRLPPKLESLYLDVNKFQGLNYGGFIQY